VEERDVYEFLRWCEWAEVIDACEEAAKRTNTELEEFRDGVHSTFAVFKYKDKRLKVPIDDLFELEYEEKVRKLVEEIKWHVENEVFC
jgi:hypothetical protein